jgi:hypothetical protein
VSKHQNAVHSSRRRPQEIREASLQAVRTLSGFTTPSKANEVAFQRTVE